MKHVVTHHVEGSVHPDYTDTDQPRPVKLEGDRLEIGVGETYRRVFERVPGYMFRNQGKIYPTRRRMESASLR